MTALPPHPSAMDTAGHAARAAAAAASSAAAAAVAPAAATEQEADGVLHSRALQSALARVSPLSRPIRPVPWRPNWLPVSVGAERFRGTTVTGRPHDVPITAAMGWTGDTGNQRVAPRGSFSR
jgi:hypothetical protein